MRTGRKAAGGRREPVFDATPIPGMGLRLSAADRPGGAPASSERKSAKSASNAGNGGEASSGTSRGWFGFGGTSKSAANSTSDDVQMRGKGGAARTPKAANDDSREAPPRRGRTRGRGGGRRGGGLRRGLGRFFYWATVACLWVGIAGIGVLIYAAAHLPPIQDIAVPKRPPSVQIVGLNGAALATRGEMGGSSIPLKELPKYVPSAFLAIEDRRFYSHFGVDVFGVVRAVAANLMRRGVSQGGSTITQQLAKNLFLTQDRTLGRKVQELLLAFWLEHKFSKDQILELYVNRVYFGAGAYGVEAAAQKYFGKSARSVTLAEAAMLAGLVKSPSRLAPTRNLEAARKRGALVLAAMVDARFVTAEMAKSAAGKPAQLAGRGSGAANYVADWVMDVLDDLIGRFDEDLVVETTVDPALQAEAERALAEGLDAQGEKLDVEQGALVAMTPEGAVRALVGGRNYAESQFNRAIAAKRQPGSAFKPFVYLAALERGLTPDTLRDDRPINIKGWRPENYTREYFGAVPLSRALAMSLNTVAVRLAVEVGPQSVAQTAHRLGIASKLDPNASLALGTSEVSVLEMATAFTPFANGGLAMTPHVVARVRTAGGKVLYRRTDGSLGRIVEPRVVGMMNQMMRETLLTGTARKAELPGWVAAGKTGTSQEFRDAWFVGYTGRLVTAVWLGNDDSSPTRKMTGGGLPVDVWSRFMKAAHQNQAVVELPGVSSRFAAPAAPGLPPPAPVSGRPPAPMPAGGPPPREQAPTLDRWLLDTVFGRR